jgi:hypothetical protein
MNLFKSSLAALALGVSAFVQADDISKNTLCLFDPVGKGGDMYALLKDFRTQALGWGVDLDLKAFDNESVIIDSFKAGQCDAIAVTGMKMRAFNKFTSTVEAVGALPEYMDVKALFDALSRPELAKYMRQGEYEVAAVMPVGNVYTFVRDRKWVEDGLQDNFQGKKVSVFEGDNVSYEMIRSMGANPVMVNTTTFAGKFNNGAVDITFAPAVAYEPFELYKGLKPNGGIVRHPMIQLTFQMVIRHEKFPSDFAAKARKAAYDKMAYAMQYVHLTEKRIPEDQWVEPLLREQGAMNEMMRQARIKLRSEGIYDGSMLKLMRKIRCQRDPRHFECAEKAE